MRSVIVLVSLAFLAVGCRSTKHNVEGNTLLRREHEMLDIPAKRKQAIFDFSDHPPSNGPDAYFEEQARNRRSK